MKSRIPYLFLGLLLVCLLSLVVLIEAELHSEDAEDPVTESILRILESMKREDKHTQENLLLCEWSSLVTKHNLVSDKAEKLEIEAEIKEIQKKLEEI